VEEPDDRALAARAAADPDAFAALYRRHVATIHAFAWRRSGSRDVAEEVTSATFERALASIGRFEWRGGGFVAWLHRIAAHELVAHHRRADRAARDARRVAALGDDDGEAIDPFADDWPRVRAALDRLRPATRRSSPCATSPACRPTTPPRPSGSPSRCSR